MILIIDGYNVINRVPELRASLQEGLEQARMRLALQVATWNRIHKAYEPIIVFDGRDRSAGGFDQRLAGIRCVFSQVTHGGDEEIIRRVRQDKARGADVVVVSDDNKVINNSRVHGALVRPSAFIMDTKALTPSRAPYRGRANVEKGISRKEATEIDQELKKKFGI